MNHPVVPKTTSLFAIRSTGVFAAMLYERRIKPNLREGLPICLPCYSLRQPEWEAAKTKLDELLPEGWSVQWGTKPGVLVLTQVPATHSIPA